MINQTELAAGLVAIQTQVAKVALEQSNRFDAVTAKVAELEAIIAAGGTIGTAVETAFAGVQSAVQALDDVIPDAPVR